MEKELFRVLNDQTSEYEPLQIDYKVDLMTSAGIARLCALAVNDSDQFFSHFASGTGTTQERKSDLSLADENTRVSMADSGYQFGAGTSMKFAGFFPTTVDTATVTEGAVFDGPVGGVMLFRSLYNVSINHIQFQTVYSLTQTIIVNAIADEGL